MNRLICIIPARAGSKSVSKKNIKKLAKYPLIAYSIIASKLSQYIERTIVSTDSKEIAEIAKHYGAEVPFLRPKEYATDISTDIGWVKHFLYWWCYKAENQTYPTHIVHLRPTTPLREPKIVDEAIKKILKNNEATALRSAHLTKETAYKCFTVEHEFFKPIIKDPRKEFYNLPRQLLIPTYRPNGYVDVIISNTVLNTDTLHGNKILSFLTKDVGEVDSEDDFDYIEWRLKKYGNVIYDYLKQHYT